MRYDHLVEAVSEEEPCGPDLDEIGDDVYLNYILPAADRLPDRFYDRDTGAPFDRASVDLKSEVKIISELLERSRDLRLLALEARFQALAGQATGFSECLQAMAALLDQRWEDVHPKALDGDFTLRQNTLAALDDRTTIILPLEYAPLAVDKRYGPVRLRDYRVAMGEAEAREEESQRDSASLIEALRQDETRESVETMHGSLTAARRALSAIATKFADAAGYEYVPSFDGIEEVLGRMCAFIEAALPDLAGGAAEDAAAEEETAAAAGAEETGGEAPAAAVVGAAVANHAAATAALLAVERYFASCEPSSPSLILIHQARTLVGKPLVAALDLLLPETAERATISFDNRPGFQLTMPRMRSLTEAATNGAANAENGAGAPEYKAGTRQEAESLIQGVEAFFRRTEPSSPVPMLLARAKTFMNRDFSAILADMIKSEG